MLLTFGAAASLRLSKKPRSRGIGRGGSLPTITAKGGLSGPAAISLATHSVVMPVTISTLQLYFFSKGSVSDRFITSDHRPPYPVTTRVGGDCASAAPARSGRRASAPRASGAGGRGLRAPSLRGCSAAAWATRGCGGARRAVHPPPPTRRDARTG